MSNRKPFHDPQKLVDDVFKRIREAENSGNRIDYLTFVPDEEPPLDSNLGAEIRMLKESGLKIAVITNSSLIWREDVRQDLEDAEWISFKVDTVRESTWKRINRPYDSFDFELIR